MIETENANAVAIKYESGKATIEFDPSMVSSDEIQKTITNIKIKDYIYALNNKTINTKPSE